MRSRCRTRTPREIPHNHDEEKSPEQVIFFVTPTHRQATNTYDMEPAGPNTINPLLHLDGSARLCPNWPAVIVERVGSGVLVASGGGSGGGVGDHRHARLVHERTPRRFEVTIDPALGRSAGEVEMLRQAIAVTRGGSKSTRWRAPGDAAGDVESAPRWRILNAGLEGGEFSLERYMGGVAGRFTVVLEEV